MPPSFFKSLQLLGIPGRPGSLRESSHTGDVRSFAPRPLAGCVVAAVVVVAMIVVARMVVVVVAVVAVVAMSLVVVNAVVAVIALSLSTASERKRQRLNIILRLYATPLLRVCKAQRLAVHCTAQEL